MTWTVIVKPPARRAIVRFPPRIADVVFRFMVEALAENPYRVTKPLSVNSLDTAAATSAFRFASSSPSTTTPTPSTSTASPTDPAPTDREDDQR